MNISAGDMDISGFVYLSDIAPNPALEIMEAYAEKNIGSLGETIQFNGTIIPLTGQPPYQYRWDFGDEKTSTQMNPTHAYDKAGEFTYTFTVTDQAGDTASETGSITISTEGGSNGSSNTPMMLFLAILAIVIVVGVVVIIWIIRRR
jgi:PKD repeat protein